MVRTTSIGRAAWVLAWSVIAAFGGAAGGGEGDAPWADDAAAILDGVDSVPSPGVPGTLVVFGDDAFPVLVNGRGETVMAGARVGRGRVVAFGHGGLIGAPGGERLRANIARWLVGGRERVRAFGIDDATAAALRDAGAEVEVLGAFPASLDGVDLVFGSVHGLVRDRGLRVAEADRWLVRGGGLLAADTAWGYLQLGHADTIGALPCNRLMNRRGLAWTNTLRDAPGGKAFVVPGGNARVPALASHALHAARICAEWGKTGTPGDTETGEAAVASVGACLGSVEGAAAVAALLEPLRDRAEVRAAFASMGERALDPGTDPLACVVLDMDSARWMALPADEVEAHPSAAAFPGTVPDDAPRDAVSVRLDPATHGWRSTGLYAAAGEVVTLGFGERLVGSGAAVQVGAWRDPQSFRERVRLRSVLRRWDIDAEDVRVASAVGGPIYIDLPPGIEGGEVVVRVDGAVRAPHYRAGVTDERAWREMIRQAPGPWAELESGEVVLTLPSAAVRDLDDPAALMAHWDRVHDAMQELEPRQASHWGDRQFRYVSEKRLSWGYMYCPSDGPIVVPTSAAHEAADLEFITRPVGQPTMWGWYHEMGHSHQNPMWTFGGLGEVTVNIFTVYAMDRVLGVDPNDDERARIGPSESRRRYEAFKGSDLAFPGDAFTGLAMYALMWQAFGWEPYERVFAEYRSLAPEDRPVDDQAKRDQWLVRMSQATGRDLGAYFSSWRVGASEEAQAAVAHLPGWMPE